MDRQIQYPAQIPLVEDMLNAQRNAMVGVGHLAGAAFGANTVAASGFACAPGEGLALTLAPGALLAPGVVDASAYGTLAAVSSALVRQFISRDPVTLAVPAAGATYIVSAAPQTVDTDDTVLPFYNAADPSVTYAGEGNSGLAAPTARRDEAALSIGASVPKGSYPLWQIIVPAGATAITAGMISVASGAPFYPSLASVAPRIVAPFNAQLAAAMGGYPLNAVVADPTTPGTFWVSTADANVSTPGASGAMWQSLFNGYATEDWANKSFVKNNAGTQGGIVALDLDGDGSGRVTFEAASGHWGALQPAGDYATNTALTQGLAGKQPIGDYATQNQLPFITSDTNLRILTFWATVNFGTSNPQWVSFPTSFKAGTIPFVFLQPTQEVVGSAEAWDTYYIMKKSSTSLDLDNTGCRVGSFSAGINNHSSGTNLIPITAIGYIS